MDAPTELQRQCPQCAHPMAHLSLQGHGAQPVMVDHCASCRLVWFDAMESVRLSGLGWIRLLRELQRGAAGEPPAPRPPTLACPACSATLKAVRNATRFGRFPMLECRQRHGHLHSHSGMLAERGLVRPLLGPERRALAEERRLLNCLNCGAACDGESDECSYCLSPLVVIDLPRLATALRQRAGNWTDSPPPAGVPLAWPCRGCGRALDPSVDAACGACGHAVVAPSLLDVTPLLASIEHELRSAELATRPYRRKPERRTRTWRDTGLGMLQRFWRVDAGERYDDFRQRLVVAAVLMFVLWLLRR
ncbi:MAG TPA: zf-TFIIB domain-containing protein [Burkholderiaceae bacterium]|nr:zf-TFIIB domain-containing protein [Burkholderiaceae bacterium]